MKHAWMIITHGNFAILEKLIRFLDSDSSDIYIHLDAKVPSFDFERFSSIAEKSSVTFTERYSVHWGDVSMVYAEYALLRAAGARHYDYYHLISGADVPVKSLAEIESYFAARPGRNFICFQAPEILPEHLERVKYYYPLQNRDFKNKKLRYSLKLLTVLVQKAIGIDRTRKQSDTVFQKGTQWVSISDPFAQYVLSREEWAKDTFAQSYCSDEMLMQTLIINSAFCDTLPENAFQNDHAACCRYIDWTRGRPYTFRDADYDELTRLGEDYLFARKFDYACAPGMVDKLFSRFGRN